MKERIDFQIAGLYRGMFLPFVSAGAINSLLFAGYGLTLKLLHPNETNVRSKELPMSEVKAIPVIRFEPHQNASSS